MDQQPQQQSKSRRHQGQMYAPAHERADGSSEPNTTTLNHDAGPELSKSVPRRGRGKFQAPAEASVHEECSDAPIHSPKDREVETTRPRSHVPDESKRSSRATKHKSMPVADHSTAKHGDSGQDRRRSRLHDEHRGSADDVDKLGDSMAALSTGPPREQSDDGGQREDWEDLLKDYDHYDSNENESARLTNRKKTLSSHIDLFAAPPAEAPVVDEPTTVLDCYDFPPAFKTHHLHDIFREYENLRGGYKIKWLEDTRALIMFEHPSTAKKAYIDNVSNPLAKIRPYSGPMNLLRSTSHSQVPRRQPTTDVVARRLLHGALGVRPPPRSKEQRQAEKDMFKAAKDERMAKKANEALRTNEVAAAFDE